MAEIHYSDSEPILDHEEFLESFHDDDNNAKNTQGHSKDGLRNMNADEDGDGAVVSALPAGVISEKTAYENTAHVARVDADPSDDSAQIEPVIFITETEPQENQTRVNSIGYETQGHSQRESFNEKTQPSQVFSRRSDLSDVASNVIKYEEDRDRALSVPLHASRVLCHPTAAPTAVFYDDDEEVAGNGPVNGHAVVDQKSSNPSSLASTNELKDFAGTLDGDSTRIELDAVERGIQWDLNYQEAAIYLEEGANNDKFDTHPRDQASLPAYQMVHNRYFYALEFVVAILLMSLAFIEYPAVLNDTVNPIIHGLLELFFLGIISIESVMKIRWMSPRVFFRHKRSMIKVLLLVVMFLEALVVTSLRHNHFRITRALRPLFLMDCRYARGVRRFVRQILLSLPPVIEMCILLLFFNFIFAILGNSFFSDTDAFFPDLAKSFVSLFVLFSSANYPDVMMADYANTPLSFFFFFFYLIIELYFIMNLLLAVVVNCFSDNELKKLKGLLLHRREACRRAFKLLNSKSHPNQVAVKHFVGMMRYFKASRSTRDVYLSYKVINKSETGLLSLEEFMNVYEASELNWKEHKEDSGPWFNHVVYRPMRLCGEAVNKFVKWKFFKYLVFVVLFSNAVFKAFSSSMIDDDRTLVEKIFLGFYIFETVVKMFGLGPRKYFRSAWNKFDFIITILAIFVYTWDEVQKRVKFPADVVDGAELVEKIINVLRPLRLLRLFKYRKRYRDVFATVFVLLPRMSSVGMVLLLLYYSYAVIGMEIFHPYAPEEKLINCCNGTSFEASYKNNTGFYYVNNFDNILRSMVTLFELTVVNNWFIIMEGFAKVTGSEWTRIFFMTFYLMTMVVMNIVIAFILEAFTFRIDYRKSTDKDMDEDALVKVSRSLGRGELRMIGTADETYQNWTMAFKRIKSAQRPPPPLADALHGNFIVRNREVDDYGSASSTSLPLQINTDDSTMNGVKFRATRSRRKVDFSIKMFADQVEEWYKENDKESSQDEGTPLLTLSQRRKNTMSATSVEES